MGKKSSKIKRNNEDTINELQKRLEDLENIDRNEDGKFDKKEINRWLKRQRKDINNFKKEIEKEITNRYNYQINSYKKNLSNAQLTIRDLQKQILSLKNFNRHLETKMSDLDEEMVKKLSQNIKDTGILSNGTVTKKRINELVDKLISDKNVNISYLPDFVEKQIYKNVLHMIISLLHGVIKTSSVEFLGHQLKFTLNPIDTEINNDDNNDNNDDDNIDNE